MRRLLITAAALTALVYVLTYFSQFIDLMVAAVLGVALTLILGVLIVARRTGMVALILGIVASLTALIGWGSNLVLWMTDPDRTGQVVNTIGMVLPPVAILLFLLAAVVAGPGRARDGQPGSG